MDKKKKKKNINDWKPKEDMFDSIIDHYEETTEEKNRKKKEEEEQKKKINNEKLPSINQPVKKKNKKKNKKPNIKINDSDPLENDKYDEMAKDYYDSLNI